MFSSNIQNGDNLYRHSVFPISFKGNQFASAKFWNFKEKTDLNQTSIVTSLAWERYVPSKKYVHAYGCRLASRITEKRKSEGKTSPKYRHVYCGSYQLNAEAIRLLTTTDGLADILSADVIHEIENGEIAHTNLKIFFKPVLQYDLEGTKTAIIDRLWSVNRGPLLHVCKYDRDIANGHPNESLQVPPSGEYLDARSYLLCFWFILRFHVEMLCRRVKLLCGSRLWFSS